MNQTTLANLTLSACLLIGCAQTHLHASLDGDATPGKTGARVGAAGSGAQTAPAGYATAGRDGAASGAPSSTLAGAAGAQLHASDGSTAEVWIGQLWSQTPALCPDERLGFMLDPAGYYQRVALILETDAQAQLSGRIKFGEGPAPTNPVYTKDADGMVLLDCNDSIPTLGVEYTVLEATRTPSRLLFNVAPNEAWVSWCAKQMNLRGWVCRCDADGCRADLHGRLPLDLAITADFMEGDVLDPGYGAIGQLRLRRVQ